MSAPDRVEDSSSDEEDHPRHLVDKLKEDLASDSCYGDDQSHTDEHNDDEDSVGHEEKEKSKFSGRGVTLPMLMQEGLIEPGKGVMSIDYLVSNFKCLNYSSWEGETGAP